MTEIKRYEDVIYGPSSYDFEEDASGAWVKYEDHAAEVTRLNEQVRALTAEIERRDAAASEPVAEVTTWYPLGTAGGKQRMIIGLREIPPEGTKLYTAAQPAVLPPAMILSDVVALEFAVDNLHDFAAGANYMRRLVTALGCQPEKVVMLPQPEKDGGTDWQGDIIAGCVNRMRDKCIAALDAAGVKYETTPPADG